MSQENLICLVCKKKLKITAIKCKCNNYFCKIHKYENNHNCTFDYKSQHKDILEKCMPIIQFNKINNI